MFNARKYIFSSLFIASLLMLALVSSSTFINSSFRPSSETFQKKLLLTGKIHTAAPAIIPSGRNIAFESGNALANAPASYLTLLDCCESDEAIADRIAFGQLRAKVRKKNTHGSK